MLRRFFTCSAFLTPTIGMTIGLGSHAFAEVIYDEVLNGDLSNSRLTPALVAPDSRVESTLRHYRP
jgi:hypothetical protein